MCLLSPLPQTASLLRRAARTDVRSAGLRSLFTDPSITDDEQVLLGAACHSCLLVPETSWEIRDNLLDRTPLVETIAEGNANLFRKMHSRTNNAGGKWAMGCDNAPNAN